MKQSQPWKLFRQCCTWS